MNPEPSAFRDGRIDFHDHDRSTSKLPEDNQIRSSRFFILLGPILIQPSIITPTQTVISILVLSLMVGHVRHGGRGKR
jgi:hypothetical protein